MAKKKNINYTEIKNKTKTSDQLVNKTKTKNKGETNISPKSANIKVNKNPIIKKLNKIKLFDDEILEVGTIVSVKDGVAQVKGLKSVTSGEMVFLGYLKIKGMVLSLEQKIVSVVIFGNDTLFGRVIDALGNIIDGGSNPTRFNVIRYNFLLVIFCLYNVKDVFIFNKFQNLVILLLTFVCINVKNLLVVKNYLFILLILKI